MYLKFTCISLWYLRVHYKPAICPQNAQGTPPLPVLWGGAWRHRGVMCRFGSRADCLCADLAFHSLLGGDVFHILHGGLGGTKVRAAARKTV